MTTRQSQDCLWLTSTTSCEHNTEVIFASLGPPEHAESRTRSGLGQHGSIFARHRESQPHSYQAAVLARTVDLSELLASRCFYDAQQNRAIPTFGFIEAIHGPGVVYRASVSSFVLNNDLM